MTDTSTSGESFAPAAVTPAPAGPAETAAFGSTRGSGLARGKRSSSAAAPTAAHPAKGDYKPTALEIITPEREYKNPFASQEPATAPAKEEISAPEIQVATTSSPVGEQPVAAEIESEPVAEKREIQILPPAESNRPAVSWESPSAMSSEGSTEDHPQRDERPTFRPDRREDRMPAPRPPENEPPFEARQPGRDASFQRQPRDPREQRQPRDPRESREPRQPRDPRMARQPRDPRDYPELEQRPRNLPSTPAQPAPRGFFAWLKGLFAGPKPVETPAPRESGGGDSFGDGHRPRRRHRGGRGHGGHGGNSGGPGFRGERQPNGERPSHGGEQEGRGGERHGGPRRRRRGGPGRDRGGDPGSQGHQGGGAI